MKTFYCLFLVVVALAVVGCGADHSGDTQAPVPATNRTPTNPADAQGANPNIPDSAKDALKNVAPMPPSGGGK